MSRNHARLVSSADSWTLSDLGSTNGILIDGVVGGWTRTRLAEVLRLVRDRAEALSVGGDRARPGHLHVTTLAQAGYAGRQRTFVVGLALMGGMYLLVQRTRVGLAMRAVSQDLQAAQTLGIPVRRVIALAWVLRNDNVCAIPKASIHEHVRENARALEVQLDDEDLKMLDAEFPPPRGPAPLDFY